ncbi:DUF1579 family protein [Falsiroseomonas oryziterrae]|uniref:DUF1579 family protein n=1 Tax=Falsiroseomonas oryziterrae TaxID=2911368 RepID=UPI001F33E09D|nr:DUF1579 family protein [Roseomonas sp. NPKOSM-4]
MDTHVADRTLSITRRIPATPEEVFAAWVNPESVRQWFGPRGMTVPRCEIDLRPGGLHHTVMRDASGRDYDNPLVIEAVEPGRRLVLRVPEVTECPVPGARGTLLFLPDAHGTRFEARWDHPTVEARARHLEAGFERGWDETIDKLIAHLASPAPGLCPMAAPLTPEHGWLHRLLGEWRYETECTGPDGTPMRAAGRESVRSLGGQWVIGEAEGTMPGVGAVRWVVTMGFDAKAGRFRGSWVGSMMPHMFLYDGALSEDGRTLTLDNEGPSFDGTGTSRYRDIVELRDADTRFLMSEVQGADGGWTRFMTATFRRAG